MARHSTPTVSNGDLLNPMQKKTRNGGHIPPPKQKSKKPAKSNITTKVTRRPQESQATVGAQEDADEDGDSSSSLDLSDPDEEPDVPALSGASPMDAGEDTPRLTGSQTKDSNMFEDLIPLDDPHATAGSAMDSPESEDDYADVENVSDGGESDDEDNVLLSAERDLIEDFERTEKRKEEERVTLDLDDMALDDDFVAQENFSSRMWDHPNFALENMGLNVNMNDDPFHGLSRDHSLYHDMWDEAESELWRMPETVRNGSGNDANSTQKRVRFEEKQASEESDSSSSEDPNEAFPDLFTPTDDAITTQRIALDLEQDLDFAPVMEDAESCYDFEDEHERFAFEVDEESDSEYDSSTYDSDDEGDTTDDESREEQIARMKARKRAAGRSSNSPPSTPAVANRDITTASTPADSRPTTPASGRAPKTGTFAVDPTRPYMTTDSEGKKVKLYPPTRPTEKDKAFWERAKTANSTRATSSSSSACITMPSPAAEDPAPPRPLTARSTLGSMFNGDLDILRNHDHSGIAEDLFPTMGMFDQRQASFNTNTTTDESETDVNMQDFLAMGDSDSESDSAPLAQLTSSAGDDDVFLSNGLLDHFDQRRGIVSSFRRNQHTAKHFSSLASHPGKRASTHEFNALQKGKRGAANTPMTPARKKRQSQDLALNMHGSVSAGGVRKSISSPLNARRPRSRGNSLGGINRGGDLFQTLARNPFE